MIWLTVLAWSGTPYDHTHVNRGEIETISCPEKFVAGGRGRTAIVIVTNSGPSKVGRQGVCRRERTCSQDVMKNRPHAFCGSILIKFM